MQPCLATDDVYGIQNSAGQSPHSETHTLADITAQGSTRQDSHSYGTIVANDNANLHLGNVINQYYTPTTSRADAYTILRNSLAFERMDARLRNVALPLPATCEWLVHHKSFRQWIDIAQIADHHGFLWIKGKPGSGKSTIMKETLSWAESNWSSDVILSYFFNARSPDVLEKSSLGLYRSLLYQLLCLDTAVHDLFQIRFKSKIKRTNNANVPSVEPWTVTEIQNFFIELFSKSNANREDPVLDIFIDALDEGELDDIRHLVRFLERLTHRAAVSARNLRICLSSRHYPHISIKKGLSLILEDQTEHSQDIHVYVQSELAGDCGLEMDVLRSRVSYKSNGVFLWVVLITHILNQLYDEGESLVVMSKKLDETPSDIFLVFSQILSRQSEGIEACGRMLRWVLFAQRPLSPLELYTALHQPCQTQGGIEEPSISEREINKHLLHCSRGLVELTKVEPVTIQFIHESVRNYLLGTGDGSSVSADHSSHPLMYSYLPGHSHIILADQCLQYLLQVSTDDPEIDSILRQHPFTSYAAVYWWRHMKMGRPAVETPNYWQGIIAVAKSAINLMMDTSKLALWLKFYNPERQTGRYLPLSTIFLPHNHALHYAAMIDASEIVSTILSEGADVDTRSDHYEMTPLHVAASSGSEKAVQVLIEAGADVNAKNSPGDTALHFASFTCSSKAVQHLLDRGAQVDCQNNYGVTPLQLTGQKGGHYRLLENANACLLTTSQGPDTKPTFSKCNLGFNSTVLVPLKTDFDTKHLSIFDQCAIIFLARDPAQMLRTLSSAGVVVKNSSSGETMLHLAAREGHEKAVQALLDNGYSPNTSSPWWGNETPLHSAVMEGHIEVAEILIDGGANIYAMDSDGDNAYSIAKSRGYTEISQLLRRKGGCTPPAETCDFSNPGPPRAEYPRPPTPPL